LHAFEIERCIAMEADAFSERRLIAFLGRFDREPVVVFDKEGSPRRGSAATSTSDARYART